MIFFWIMLTYYCLNSLHIKTKTKMNTLTEKTSISSLKQVAKTNLKTQYSISKNVAHIWVIAITNLEKREFIIRWISDLWMGAVVLCDEEINDLENVSSSKKLNPNMLMWFDFFVYDNDHDWVDVVKFMWAWIVPIMPEKNTFSWILKDFNPMRFEWNWFFYKKDSPYCIFEKIISYTENIKFPEDKRVLLKNVLWAF
ncbi:MAG: hypothetical protein ACD_4C00136G0003 [uncultured bacterium (gcode 4)]|uniref:Uncharacterized protein n=1 Tax=uncultured bacterium (gcode 4) TaxID=1234023 RepID=K2FV59_9BACT|nr:MAG: hypothetical protein ACD_4C00136G0003 [uncultured bacterium (gcode 4)]